MDREHANHSDVLIIGAGISGLLAAENLTGRGLKITVLEKSRGVGGRMAVRRIGEGVFDHGVQFITTRNAALSERMTAWLMNGEAGIWCYGFRQNDGHPHYCGSRGMTTIPKRIAQSMDIRFQEHAADIALQDGHWQVTTQAGARYDAPFLLITCPLPQAVDLLESSAVPLSTQHRQRLQSVSYDPCLTLLALLDAPSRIPQPGGLFVQHEPLHFIADNQKKGVSPVPCVTIHATPQFSLDHYQDEDDSIAASLLQAVDEWLPAPPQQVQIKRWRYCQPVACFEERFLSLHEDPPLLLAGDAFQQPGIEGAALSGLAASNQLLQVLQP